MKRHMIGSSCCGAMVLLGAAMVFGHAGDLAVAVVGAGLLMAGFLGSLRYLLTECGVRR